MDGSRFDALTRSLAGGASRRGFLGGLAAIATGLAGVRAAGAACPAGQVQGAGGRCLCRTTGRPPVAGLASCPAGSVPLNGCCVRCPSGQTACGGVCVDLRRDAAHCGACGATCAVGAACCGGRCVDIATDPANCGGCRAACAAGQSCAGGTCCADQGDACAAVGCCPGTFCEALTGSCLACQGEGTDCSLTGPAACCGAPGLGCFDQPGPGGGDVCHDPAACVGPNGACDEVNFVCCAGTFCDAQIQSCLACQGEGADCSVAGPAACCAAPGLGCFDQPGPGGGDVCHDPAVCVGPNGGCDGVNFVCCAGLTCTGEACQP